jgi:hypothetical protein
VRAGVEPERIVAGTLLLLVAGSAVILGSTAILGAILGAILSNGFHEPPSLLWGLTVVGFGAVLTWLSVVVLAGRHSQRALALAAAAVLMAAAIAGLDGATEQVAILLLGVAFANIVALLIGTYRLAQR